MRLLSAVFPLSLLLLVPACYVTPATIYEEIETSKALFDVNPADIAVLPIEDATTHGSAAEACGPIRDQIVRALVKRLYTPLSTRKVDEILAAQEEVRTSVVDANWLSSVGGHFGEDATLAVRLTAWDPSKLMSSGWVSFGADVALVTPQNAEPLWGGSFSGAIKAGGESPAPFGRQGRQVAVAREFARHLAGFLPRRNP